MMKLDNFRKSLDNLRLITQYDEPYDIVVRSGLVNLFSICFEQSWKAMKEILEDQGFGESRTGSPRMIIKLAYSAGMIKDENGWLHLLNRRNEVAHSYDEDIANDIIRDTKEEFLPLFEELYDEICTNWMPISEQLQGNSD